MIQKGDFIVSIPEGWPMFKSRCGVVSEIIDYWTPPALQTEDGCMHSISECTPMFHVDREVACVDDGVNWG